MKKIRMLIFLLAALLPTQYAYCVSQLFVSKGLEKKSIEFESIEHRQLGDRVELSFGLNALPKTKSKLKLTNGMQLSYGDIVALAGDFFGRETVAISDCQAFKKIKCFNQHFSDLDRLPSSKMAKCHSPFFQIKKYFKIFDALNKAIKHGEQKGIPAFETIKTHSESLNKQFNKVGCGGSFISAFFPLGKYLLLAQHNWDHFVPNAIDAYNAGHQAALLEAKAAFHAWHDELNSDKALSILNIAYAKNAFANHFLSDAFSSGHMRVPRKQIHQKVYLVPILKLLLANFMHDEDNQNGLEVINLKGDRWTAYGDGYVASSKRHQEIILKAMQSSANAVYQTYLSGVLPSYDETLEYLPIYELLPRMNATSPMFKLHNNKLLRRKNLNDIYDHHYLKSWNGLLSLVFLETMH